MRSRRLSWGLALVLGVGACDETSSRDGEAAAVAANGEAKAEDAKAEDAKAEDAKAEDAKAEDANVEDAEVEDAEAEPDPAAGSDGGRWGEMSEPKPRPGALEPPTAEEFAAWDRADPAGAAALSKWDATHVVDMLGYWEDLVCYREAVMAAGEAALDATPGSKEAEAWLDFKKSFVPEVDGWQKRLFASESRILEKSKYIGMFLEAHELAMYGYLAAYNDSDATAIAKADASFRAVSAKVETHTISLGATWPDYAADAAARAAHAEHCNDLRSK